MNSTTPPPDPTDERAPPLPKVDASEVGRAGGGIGYRLISTILGAVATLIASTSFDCEGRIYSQPPPAIEAAADAGQP